MGSSDPSSDDFDDLFVSSSHELLLEISDSIDILSNDWFGKLLYKVGSASAGYVCSVPFVTSRKIPPNIVCKVFSLKIGWSSGSRPCLMSSKVKFPKLLLVIS